MDFLKLKIVHFSFLHNKMTARWRSILSESSTCIDR